MKNASVLAIFAAHAATAACLIQGTVVDAGTGKPVAGAEFWRVLSTIPEQTFYGSAIRRVSFVSIDWTREITIWRRSIWGISTMSMAGGRADPGDRTQCRHGGCLAAHS